MEARTLTFIVIGCLAAGIGGIMTIVAAFRQSVLWGLAVLFLPLANFVFTVMHWAEAKKGLFVSLAGCGLVALGLATSPAVRVGITKLRNLKDFQLPANGFAMQSAQAAGNVDEQIAKQRAKLEQLDAKFAHDGQLLVQEFTALTEQRKMLKQGDAQAVDAFNRAVAEYQSHNTARQAAKDEIAASRLELETLQDLRARQVSGSTAPGGRKVVIYTTATCPACKMAKSYFAKKGVPYEEHDVNSSPEARAAFQKLGGHGVPLILVGPERLEGFSQQRLDQLL